MMPNATHHEFTVEEVYPNDPPARVFEAFTDAAARLRWFFSTGGGTEIEELHQPASVVPGARESSRFSMPHHQGAVVTNDTTWLEVVPDAWLVFAYVMTINGGPLSSSLSTVRFEAEGAGTRLVFTEQGVFHDKYAEGRRDGTQWMMKRLGHELAGKLSGDLRGETVAGA